jgi:hypothetical protein
VEFSSGSNIGSLFARLPLDAEETWELPVFPRRQETVRVRVYQHVPDDRWMQVPEFVVPNPTPGPYPTWKPQPLPSTQTIGDLAVTLTRLATDGMPGGPLSPSPPGENTWMRASFHITRQGRPTTAWKPVAVAIADATGNVWKHRNQAGIVPASGTDLRFGGTLSATDAAYKLDVELSQTTGFSTGELWSVRSLPVPKRNQLIDPAATVQRQGAELRLTLAGPGDPYRLGRSWRQPFSALKLAVSSPSPGLQVTLLRAIDDRGQRLTVFGGGPASMGSGEYHYMLARTPPGAHTMDLLFALHRNRSVQFVVAPPRS